MTWSARRARFRAILAGDRCVRPASVFDPISARIAEDLGFESALFAGSLASLTVLGAPDLVVATLTEVADQCLRISRAGDLPLLVDADHGFGNALNAQRTVQELEIAGVSALSIEDTQLPTPFDAANQPPLIPIAEGVGKMKAAVAGKSDPDMVVAARTKLTSGGLDDLTARIKAYSETGVDALFVTRLTSREHVDAVHASSGLPVILGQLTPELDDADYLRARNVKVALQGHKPFMAAVQAVHDTLSALRQGEAPSSIKNTASPELMKRLTRADVYASLAEDTLK